jgi:hypothetical protein
MSRPLDPLLLAAFPRWLLEGEALPACAGRVWDRAPLPAPGFAPAPAPGRLALSRPGRAPLCFPRPLSACHLSRLPPLPRPGLFGVPGRVGRFTLMLTFRSMSMPPW